MEQIINIHVEKLPEGVYLATSEDVPGLVDKTASLICRAERSASIVLMPSKGQQFFFQFSEYISTNFSQQSTMTDSFMPSGTLLDIKLCKPSPIKVL